jgi:2-polyprenyl-3-methyl-5-hydroxy-6-metoxy-1,4-benzoquinol methylase
MSFIRKTYDREYYESVFYRAEQDSQRNQNRLEQVLLNKQRGRLLEIGCGAGTFLRMAQKHFEVAGIDSSSYAIRNNCVPSDCRLTLGDIEQSRLEPETYDVVVAFNVLEHLNRPADTIRKIFRALKPDGFFFGSVPNNRGILGVPHAALTDLLDRTHVSNLKPGKWWSLMNRAGFKRIRFFGEMMLGRNHCVYLKNKIWEQIAFNLMFACSKP